MFMQGLQCRNESTEIVNELTKSAKQSVEKKGKECQQKDRLNLQKTSLG